MRWSYAELLELPLAVYEVLVEEAAEMARARASGAGGVDVDDLS
jgi:hypothetical protein